MKKIIILGVFFIFLSCDLIIREGISTAVSKDKTQVIDGDYYQLQEDNISIFLPKGFITISDAELLESYNLIEDKKTRSFYKNELESRKSNKVTYDNFFNEKLQSEVYASRLPYTPFDKASARQLLYYLRKGHERYLKATGIYHNKIKANYLGDASLQVFRASYRLSGLNTYDESQQGDNETFKTIYLITSKKKTLMLSILTPNEANIDPFIRKIKF